MTSPRQLRPEARPVGWDKLDHQQRRNFERMVDLLDEAVKDLDDEEPSTTRGPFLDHHRSSTTALVGGERGSGKTTLLLSLIQALGPDTKAADNSMPSHLVERVAELRERLVWLETLDMEPLETSANLLGATLVRVEATAIQPARPQRSSDLFSSTANDEALQNMARLQTSIALTYSDYLQNQVGKLDPTVFAMESRRIERERLSLKERFHKVLADFSVLANNRPRSQPSLFVLPVDDLDLNPTAAVQLLQLLRAVQSPYLFVVLAADPALMNTVTKLHFRSKFSDVSGKAEPTAEDYQSADDVAVEAMRKHLPRAQRLTLEKLGPESVLRFKPFGEEQTLGELVGRFRLRGDVVRLGRFTINERPLPLTVDDASRWQRFYSWPRLFRLTSREAVDIHARARRAKSPQGVLESWARIAIEDAAGGPFERAPDAISGRLGESLVNIDAKVSVRVRKLLGWDVTIDGTSLGTSKSADYVGAIDLTGAAGLTDVPNLYEPPVVPALRQTVHINPKGEPVAFDWPMPLHSTFWGYERMQAALNRATRDWDDEEPLFGSWISAMTALIGEALQRESVAETPTCATNWKRLISALSGLVEYPQIANNWLIEACALCTSDMGMKTHRITTLIRDRRLGREIDQIIADRRQQLQAAGLRRATPSNKLSMDTED